MRAMAVLVLGLLFLVELAAWAAHGIAGYLLVPAVGIVLLLGLPLLVLTGWGLFASPRARYGGPRLRAFVKVLVLGGAVVLLALAGLVAWAAALLVVIVVVHAALAWPPMKTEAAAVLEGASRDIRGE